MGLIMYGGTPYGGVRKSSSAIRTALDAFLQSGGTTGAYVNDRITKVAPYAFFSTEYSSISLPNVTDVGFSALSHCNNLSSIYLPNVAYANSDAFSTCMSLTTIILPKLLVVYASVFAYNSNLTLVDLHCAVNIDGFGILSDTAANLILRNNSVCNITYTPSSAFYASAFASTGNGGTLYVPQSLVSAYQNDTKWKQVMNLNPNNQILPIEGSPYEAPSTSYDHY